MFFFKTVEQRKITLRKVSLTVQFPFQELHVKILKRVFAITCNCLNIVIDINLGFLKKKIELRSLRIKTDWTHRSFEIKLIFCGIRKIYVK